MLGGEGGRRGDGGCGAFGDDARGGAVVGKERRPSCAADGGASGTAADRSVPRVLCRWPAFRCCVVDTGTGPVES